MRAKTYQSPIDNRFDIARYGRMQIYGTGTVVQRNETVYEGIRFLLRDKQYDISILLKDSTDTGESMNLRKYFDINHGTGVLATADKDGMVDAAIYSSPHIFEDGTIAFLMRERLTYHNVEANPYATYLFVEGETGYSGIRLYLRRIKEDNDSALISRLTRGGLSPQEDKAKGPKHLVHFRVEKILQLAGSEQADISLT